MGLLGAAGAAFLVGCSSEGSGDVPATGPSAGGVPTDLAFADDHVVRQLATVRGSVGAGYTATLSVPVEG